VCAVADGHDERPRPAPHVFDRLRARAGEIESSSPRRRDRARMDAVGGVSASALRWSADELTPQRGRQLRASGVLRAHEEGRAGCRFCPRHEVAERTPNESDVPTPAVAAGASAGDQTDVLEDIEVVSEQVGIDPRQLAQLDGRPVGRNELVDDRQARGIAERRMTPRAIGQVPLD